MKTIKEIQETTPPNVWAIADNDPSFLFMLNEQGTNKLHCQIYAEPNNADADAAAEARKFAAVDDLLEAVKATLAVLPTLEVHCWPPGHAMKKRAIELCKAALAKAEAAQ